MLFLRAELIGSTLIFLLLEIVVAALRINSLDSFVNSMLQFLVNFLMRCLFKICVAISSISLSLLYLFLLFFLFLVFLVF